MAEMNDDPLLEKTPEDSEDVMSQVWSGVKLTALGLGGAVALLFMLAPTCTRGAPASRRLRKDALQVRGLEPLDEAIGSQTRSDDPPVTQHNTRTRRNAVDPQ